MRKQVLDVALLDRAAEGDPEAFGYLLNGDDLDRGALAAKCLLRAQERRASSPGEALDLEATGLHILNRLADNGCEEAALTLVLAGPICSPEAWALASEIDATARA